MIVVTKSVNKRIEKIIEYLKVEWGEKAVENFIREYHSLKAVIEIFPHIGEETPSKPGLRVILITKHNALFYKVDKEIIYFLYIKDTRKKKYKR